MHGCLVFMILDLRMPSRSHDELEKAFQKNFRSVAANPQIAESKALERKQEFGERSDFYAFEKREELLN